MGLSSQTFYLLRRDVNNNLSGTDFLLQFAAGVQSGGDATPNTGPLLSSLFWESWYNGRNLTKDDRGYIFYENKLQGLPRIRQLRVRNDSCEIHDDFKVVQGHPRSFTMTSRTQFTAASPNSRRYPSPRNHMDSETEPRRTITLFFIVGSLFCPCLKSSAY